MCLLQGKLPYHIIAKLDNYINLTFSPKNQTSDNRLDRFIGLARHDQQPWELELELPRFFAIHVSKCGL